MKKYQRSGFTLIEIMIALVIFSMLMGIITNAIGLTGKLKDHGRSISDKYLEPYVTRIVIERDCRNFSEPLKGTGESKFDRTVIDSSQTISFYSVIQSPILQRGISKISYKAANGKLVRKLSKINGSSETSTLEFLNDLQGVEFRFSDESDPEGATSEWPHRNRIPRYIVFDFTFKTEENGRSTESSESWIFSLGQVS